MVGMPEIVRASAAKLSAGKAGNRGVAVWVWLAMFAPCAKLGAVSATAAALTVMVNVRLLASAWGHR